MSFLIDFFLSLFSGLSPCLLVFCSSSIFLCHIFKSRESYITLIVLRNKVGINKRSSKKYLTSSCSFAKFSNLDFKLPAAPEPAKDGNQKQKTNSMRLTLLSLSPKVKKRNATGQNDIPKTSKLPFSPQQKGQIGRGAESARGEKPNTNAPSQHFRACVVTTINCHMPIPVSPPPPSSPFKISPLPTPEEGRILTLSRLLLQIRKPQVWFFLGT